MKPKHTPAPWEVRFFDKSEPESGFFVQAKNNNKPELGYGIEILQDDFGEHCGYPIEQRLADAKLIAAAPELLEALVEAKKELDYHNWANTKTYFQIENAIKKATE